MSLAALLLLSTLVAMRINSNGGSESSAHGNSIEAKTAWGKGKKTKSSVARSSHFKKGDKARHWSKNGWTKAGTKTKKDTKTKKGTETKSGAKAENVTTIDELDQPSGDKAETSVPEAPTTSPRPSAPTTPPSTGPTDMPGVMVDPSTLPTPRPGVTSHRIRSATYEPVRGDGVGAFRISCYMSHMAYDDPIVAPGRPGASHLHTFFGNDSIDAYSTSSSVANAGGSTCSGGTANRSGYWTPAMVDTRTQRAVLPWQEADIPWQSEYGSIIYYKTGYQGVAADTVQNPPTGLRIVAGDASRTTRGTSTDPASPRYWCDVKDGFDPYNSGYDLNRNCRTGDILVMTIVFPQCWNGRDLDSPDHQSHMAYGTWGRPKGAPGVGCPASHPVPLPEVTMNVNYEVPASGTAGWRLASDMYDGPGGYSGHADWWNGWDREVFQEVVDHCFRPGLDCQMNLLGDGRALN